MAVQVFEAQKGSTILKTNDKERYEVRRTKCSNGGLISTASNTSGNTGYVKVYQGIQVHQIEAQGNTFTGDGVW